jgi:hypothetical protein
MINETPQGAALAAYRDLDDRRTFDTGSSW